MYSESAIKKKERRGTQKGFLLKRVSLWGYNFLLATTIKGAGGKCSGEIIYYYINGPLRAKGF